MWNSKGWDYSLLFILLFIVGCSGSYIMEKFRPNECYFGDNDIVLRPASYLNCTNECRSRSQCHAISVYYRMSLCRMHFDVNYEAIACPLFVFSEKKRWKEKIKTGCESTTCPNNNQKCDVINGVPSCKTSECERITGIRHGTVYGNDVRAGMKVAFTCEKDYELIGSPSLVCKANGEWSDTMPICQGADTGGEGQNTGQNGGDSTEDETNNPPAPAPQTTSAAATTTTTTTPPPSTTTTAATTTTTTPPSPTTTTPQTTTTTTTSPPTTTTSSTTTTTTMPPTTTSTTTTTTTPPPPPTTTSPPPTTTTTTTPPQTTTTTTSTTTTPPQTTTTTTTPPTTTTTTTPPQTTTTTTSTTTTTATIPRPTTTTTKAPAFAIPPPAVGVNGGLLGGIQTMPPNDDETTQGQEGQQDPATTTEGNEEETTTVKYSLLGSPCGLNTPVCSPNDNLACRLGICRCKVGFILDASLSNCVKDCDGAFGETFQIYTNKWIPSERRQGLNSTYSHEEIDKAKCRNKCVDNDRCNVMLTEFKYDGVGCYLYAADLTKFEVNLIDKNQHNVSLRNCAHFT